MVFLDYVVEMREGKIIINVIFGRVKLKFRFSF